MALDCNVVSFLYNSTSNIVGVVFGLTIISGIYFLIRRKRNNQIRYKSTINPYEIGSLMVISAIILYTFIPSNVRCIISIITLILGFGILLFTWIYPILYYKK